MSAKLEQEPLNLLSDSEIEQLNPTELQEYLKALEDLAFFEEQHRLAVELKTASEILEKDFSAFVREAWQILNPFTPLDDEPYVDAIAENLQATRDGLTRRLIINQPPRSAKSTCASICFPCWVWTTLPSAKFVFNSYSFDLSVAFSIQRRRLIQSEWYQARWGANFKLSFDENQKWLFSNDQTGRMEVVTGATGSGGEFLIVDDPHSVDDARSDAIRESQVAHFRGGLMTRLNNPQKDVVIVVMQRLYDSDLTGVLLKDGNWTHLRLEARQEREETFTLPISGRKWHRPVGDLIDPLRMSDAVLTEKQVELGTREFEGQYQQNPAPPMGTIFQTKWWKWYKQLPEIEQFVISVDAAFKETKNSTDVAIHLWGMAGIFSFLIKRDTQKMGFAATKAHIRAMYSQCEIEFNKEPIAVLIEDKANGPAIIEELRTEFHVIPIDPGNSDKAARAEGCSPMVEAGTVYLPDSPDGVKIQTLAAKFPNAEKDDVDAMTQFLNWRRKRGAMMKWFEAQAKKMRETLQQQGEIQTGEEVITPKQPSVREIHRLAMEEAGMKTARPQMTKPVKAEELKKQEQVAPQPSEQCCAKPNIFRSSKGRKCLNCGTVFAAPERISQI